MLQSRISNILALLSLCLILIQANANKIQGKIQLPETNQKLQPLNSTLVTLNGELSTYTIPTASGENYFTFYNVPTGVHLLNVHSHIYHFSQIKIQILEGEEPKCIEYVYPGATKRPTSHPLNLVAHANYQYFEPRPTFSPFVLFKNPMILVMIFSIGMMVVMPQMMKNLDPEQKEQMKKQMEMQSNPTEMLSQMWGEMSGSGTKELNEKKVIKKERTRLKRE